jgi:hypothetical protein
MGVSDWLTIAIIVLSIVGGLGGVLWALLQGQIRRAEASASSAHRRIDERTQAHTDLQLKLANEYVRQDRLAMDLDSFARAHILPMTDRLERFEVLVQRIADKLQVPRSDL